MQSKKIQDRASIAKKVPTNSLPVTKEYICSQKMYRLGQSDLDRFSNDYELIYCAEYLNKEEILHGNFLQKIYLLLFQAATRFHDRQVLSKFLRNYDFLKLMKKYLEHKVESSDKIMMIKIARFLNTFKQKHYSIKNLLNALIVEYHEYRMIDRFKERSLFVVISCDIVEEFISKSFYCYYLEVMDTNWMAMQEEFEFEKFYDTFSELCQIRKRIRYLSCSLIDLSRVEEIPIDTLTKIENKFRSFKVREENNQVFKENEVNEKVCQVENHSEKPMSTLAVKRRIKGINKAIRQIMNNNQ